MNVRLLRRIAKHIIAKPRRFIMSAFLRQRNRVGRSYIDDVGQEQKFEECGTAACIAGWACLLTKNPVDPGKAKELLGLEDRETETLFYAGEWPQPFKGDYFTAKTPAMLSGSNI